MAAFFWTKDYSSAAAWLLLSCDQAHCHRLGGKNTTFLLYFSSHHAMLGNNFATLNWIDMKLCNSMIKLWGFCELVPKEKAAFSSNSQFNAVSKGLYWRRRDQWRDKKKMYSAQHSSSLENNILSSPGSYFVQSNHQIALTDHWITSQLQPAVHSRKKETLCLFPPSLFWLDLLVRTK